MVTTHRNWDVRPEHERCSTVGGFMSVVQSRSYLQLMLYLLYMIKGGFIHLSVDLTWTNAVNFVFYVQYKDVWI